MRTELSCGAPARRRERARRSRVAAALVLIALLAGGCVAPPPSPDAARPAETAAAPAPSPPAGPAPARPADPPALPFEEAVATAAEALFAGARLPEDGPGAATRVVVIDPLIEGVTGAQAAATRSMEARIVGLVRERYPRFEVRRLSAESVARAPLVLLGSLTGLDEAGRPAGAGEIYRIWLVLADLVSGRIVARGTARAKAAGVDVTPTAYFRDAPTWTRDRSTEAYLGTCGGKVGDPVDPVYLEGIRAAALVADAIEAYEAARYRAALDLYTSAARTAAGDQLRVHNGLYLANWKLGRREEAAAAFGRLVDHGLRHDRLAVKLLFKPGSTAFWPDPRITAPYPMWLERIAERAAAGGSCLEITGHTSPTGPAALNERLSLLRAEHVRSRLEAAAPPLGPRLIAHGMGSRATIVGTGREDATDALDRRVEFKAFPC